MYIEGNALILGDSSYLEHHGIRGQRWGVRRFQNRDGSLTNAGRKRLGYTTKGAAQAVGKAFKAGVKAGGKAVKAVKAHHEKKEAEKLQKKKEKASKTRLGVMANKDLFTNEEIRKLNERFKLEDEMKMATLQKGVEIAKAVGTIAQNVGTVAKTYEDVTGQSLSPIKRKAAEEKARQEKEDRERRLAREDAEEARKSAKEERDIAIHEQTLRKAIASADTQEFTARKTKADADSAILDLYKKGKDFNGGGDAKTDETGKSWMEKATSGGGNVFERMKYENDPEYRAAKDAHDKKVEWEQHEKERDARVFGRDKQSSSDALNDMINASERNRKGGSNQEPHVEWNPGGKDGTFRKAEQQSKSRPSDPDDIPFTSKNLRLEKDRYAQRDAFKKAKEIKDTAEEKRAKEQDDKAAKSAIDTIMKDYKNQDDVIRNMNPGAYDREVAKTVIKNKAKDAINKISHPVDAAAKKIADKHREEKWAKERKNLWKEYEDTREKLGPEAAARAYNNAKKQALQNLGYRGEALERKMNETKFYKKKGAKHDAFSIQNGVLFIDSSNGLSHHGVKGQKWGVRRFQNEDGSLTDKGRKHYEKVLAKEKRKQVSSDAIRGTLERQHPFAVAASVALGATYAAMLGVASAAAPGAVVAGAAIAAAISGVGTHGLYSVSEAWEGRGTRMRSKKIDKYENILKQSDGENGMYHVENGTLFINAGEPYLEHHGVLGMKWGKHLRAGKGPADAPASAGGGGGEDDEKLKEMAKKAGMTVAEYRTKMAGKLSGAASKVGEKVYDAAGGSHKKEAAEYQKMSRDASNEARKYEASGNADLAKAASARRKGNTSAHSSYKTTGDNAKDEARKARERASALSEGTRQEQARYEKSLAGRYDKMKADRARSKKIKQRQSIERALSNGPVKAKPKKGLGKRLEEKLGVTHEKTDKPKQSKEAKRIEDMYKDAARKDGMQAKRKKRVAKHSDNTNAIYTEGTRLVINSKWG